MPSPVWGHLSPGIDAVMALVGKERVLARIDRALAYIEARMAAE
nr:MULTISPECIES: glutamyl-tRNA synthetase [Aeromonas]